MASRKKRMAFKDYEEALAKTEELAASGDQESDDFLAAAEAAAQFFLVKHDSRYFNRLDGNHVSCGQAAVEHKWPTIKELCRIDPLENGEFQKSRCSAERQ